MKSKLIVIDGMPGSGKTTSAIMVSEQLTKLGVANHCLLEGEPNHPLLILDRQFDSLENEEEADEFIALIQSRYKSFAEDKRKREEVTIIESVMLQDTINTSFHMGMNREKLRQLSASMQEILSPLTPALIYYYQLNPEAQWRYICGIRGNEWGPVSFTSDDDFREAGELWSGSQAFVRAIIDSWQVPKLIIENSEYKWDEYRERIEDFISKQ
ncbi:hypothetical protein M3194_13325 [Paenibacillus glycanilyticus]|uniref:hypothetical protein n=1 Tax=Paenibacillus glycanilyticus TaxID=126569 RepID=UPI00203D66F1|nr:hypothetical protein [Paenibacillus glycanilyticus]MCM3628347.1 hypothetical protein [Paenibacillus glycanilyticus]